MLASPVAARGRPNRCDHDSPHGGTPFHRKTNRSSENLRRSSRHRHRECAIVQGTRERNRGTARGAGASDGNVPRCSASSAARPPTCSRSSTPSSRAPHRFAGSMTWCCDSARATMTVPRAHFGPIPDPTASRSVLMNHRFAGCASTARSTFPTSATQTDFHNVSARQRAGELS